MIDRWIALGFALLVFVALWPSCTLVQRTEENSVRDASQLEGPDLSEREVQDNARGDGIGTGEVISDRTAREVSGVSDAGQPGDALPPDAPDKAKVPEREESTGDDAQRERVMDAAPQAVCGDGILAASEECDDRNKLSGDGCSRSCKIEISTYFTNPHETKIFDLIIRTIGLAVPKSSIHASYYLMRYPAILDALVQARKRGVNIQIVADDTPTNQSLRMRAQDICLDGTSKCVHSCVNSCLGARNGKYNTIIHNKFFLFSALSDGRKHVVFQSSSNLYSGSLTRFQDLISIPYDRPLYDGYLKHFQLMKTETLPDGYKRTVVTGRSGVTTHFFPIPDSKIKDPIIEMLDRVQCTRYSRIHVGMAYFFDSRKAIAAKLQELAGLGCEVQAIISTSWNSTEKIYKSPGFDVQNLLGDRLVKIEKSLHSKFLLIDSLRKGEMKPRRTVVTGSHNYTYSALRQNDETFMVLEDDKIYQDYLAFWKKIYRYRSAESRDTRRKFDMYSLANALQKHYAKYKSYTQPENADSDCSTGDGGSAGCGTGNQWSSQSDLRDLLKDKYVHRLPVDPINNARHHYTYEPWNGGASQGMQHKGWKYSLCASELELTSAPYCLYGELGNKASRTK